MKALLFSIVAMHMVVVTGNVASVFVLPFFEPPWVALPLSSFVLWITFNRDTCPLTRAENAIRKRLGMKPIGGFVGHYVLRRVSKRNAVVHGRASRPSHAVTESSPSLV